MLFRSSLLLVAVGSILVVATTPFADEKAAPVAKPKVTKADFEGMMKTHSNWGRWGANDELGTLNLITPEKRKQAAALVKDGVTVSLAHDASKSPIASSSPFGHKMTALPTAEEFSGASDEYQVAYHGFSETHMDGLCHMAYQGKLYNGYSYKEVRESGAAKLSVLNVKQGIYTRCILMDMPKLFAVRYLEGNQAIYPGHLEAWEKVAGVKVESGDIVLIRTGRWERAKVEANWDIMKNSAGLHASCIPWLKARDVAVVGSDLALDVMPSGVDGVTLPVHVAVLVAMGMPILDNLDLEAVSSAADARKRWMFALTVAPLAVPGGTGSPVNPLATF
ncbi:MAG: cyclase family protein [Planctomycetia bacterium]|nr:cyclase family protein [Planctomycetia bacterium]